LGPGPNLLEWRRVADTDQSATYELGVGKYAGLRLVEGRVLELLDAEGTPRLRLAPADATIAVDGCAYDASPAAPWGRAPKAPGANRCIVRVTPRAGTRAPPASVTTPWAPTKATMSTARDAAPLVPLCGTPPCMAPVLAAGGQSSSAILQTAELYDPASQTFAATGSMGVGRRDFTATRLASGQVLVAGGLNPGSSYETSAEVYDPTTGKFTPTGSMNAARSQFTATLLPSGKVLVVGGFSNVSTSVGSAEVYDPSLGTFKLTTTFPPQGRSAHVAMLLGNGKVLLAGGFSVSSYTKTADLYDPATDGFTPTGAMSKARWFATGTALANGDALVAGGRSSSSLIEQSADVYSTSAGTFTPVTGGMQLPRFTHTAARLVSGKVLLAGGITQTVTGTSRTATAEIFDPTAFAFTSVLAMSEARSPIASALVGTGQVLVAGPDASAELFALGAPGDACATHDDCGLDVCEDGHCCAGACSGTCMTCTDAKSATPGACVAVVNGDDPDTCTGASTCDAAGACKRKNGQPCPNDPSQCVDGVCSDAVCCDAACAGACDACTAALGATADGTCTIVAAHSPGNPACGGGYACDGVDATCPVTCANDAACPPGTYCAANATCVAQKAQGVACVPATDCKDPSCTECTTGHCVDGVCCDQPCNGLCMACAAQLKESGAVDGACGPAKQYTNPHHDACPTGSDPCKADGECSGTGTCNLFAKPGTACGNGAHVCSNNDAVGKVCDGAGTCANDTTGVPCAPFVCVNGSCPSTCAQDSDCVSGAWCDQGTCVLKSSNGACTTPRGCTTNVCTDGFCCDAPCQGQCEACDVPGATGSCVPVSGAPHASRAPCAGAAAGDPCSATVCDGLDSDRASCAGHVGQDVACGAASCTGGKATAAGSCNGAGGCKTPDPVPCGAYACGATACKTSCTTDADCASGSKCDVGTSKCVNGATCDGDHTVTGANGEKQDCSPYRCSQTGGCNPQCTSVADCASPNVCDTTGHCVAAPGNADAGPSGSSGCSCRSAGAAGADGGGAGLLLAAVSAAIGKLRRRRPRPRRTDFE
jgi:hypothetical protein